MRNQSIWICINRISLPHNFVYILIGINLILYCILYTACTIHYNAPNKLQTQWPHLRGSRAQRFSRNWTHSGDVFQQFAAIDSHSDPVTCLKFGLWNWPPFKVIDPWIRKIFGTWREHGWNWLKLWGRTLHPKHGWNEVCDIGFDSCSLLPVDSATCLQISRIGLKFSRLAKHPGITGNPIHVCNLM